MDLVEVVEIDIPYCSLTYGVAPCAAELGVTGASKCFNTRGTCQDKANFDPAPLTLRFVRATTDELGFDAIPSLLSISVTPQKINPGVDMGERESVRISLADHPHSDAGLDKYLADRDYNPFERGTFWGKLRARMTTLKGLPLRVRRGELGEALEDMRTSHYLIESTAGPDDRTFTVTAKDVLKVADGDRAQAPAVSRGQLAATIDASANALTLEPAGIGDSDYPSSGKACIGGSEIVSYTRVGDVVTLTQRGSSNTEATAHEEGEAFQDVLVYDSETVDAIIYDLLTSYTSADPDWIPLTDWQQEVGQFIGRLYSAEIAEPTPVRDLINELIEQCGLVFWTDVVAQQIRLTALRPIAPSSEVYDSDRIVEGTFRQKDQPKKRVSQSWTYYGLINPLEQLDNRLGYQFAAVDVDLESEVDHNDEPAIAKVFSRWIDSGNRAAAERLNELKLARFVTAPREFRFSVWRTDPTPPELGRGAFLKHWPLQDDTGAEETVPIQITSVEDAGDRYNVTAEEMVFGEALPERVVFIDENLYEINLRDLYDEIYTAPSQYDTVTFVVSSGVQVGGHTIIAGLGNNHQFIERAAITVGDWPEGPTLRLINNGTIAGGGANGQDARFDTSQGSRGGTAIRARYPISIENNGLIGGGGGGGGRGSLHGGGGGAGAIRQSPNSYGEFPSASTGGPNVGWVAGSSAHAGPGLLETGGAAGGATGGQGGNLGEAGTDGTGAANPQAGAAGYAIDGDSYVTFTVEGDVRGPRIN